MGEELTIQEMDNAIKQYINEYDGTAIGEHISRWRENTYDDDYDAIEEIYNEVMTS